MNSVKNYVWHSARDFAEDFIWRSIGEPMYNGKPIYNSSWNLVVSFVKVPVRDSTWDIWEFVYNSLKRSNYE